MLQAPIDQLKGIGPQKSKRFNKLGIHTLEDLLMHLPFRYEDRRLEKNIAHCLEGDKVTLRGYVVAIHQARVKGNKTLTKVLIDDGSGQAQLVFMNVTYIDKQFERGQAYVVHGHCKKEGARLSLFHPDFKKVDDKDKGFGIVPVYALTDGLSQKDLQKALDQVLARRYLLEDALPEPLRRTYGYPDLSEALLSLHKPSDTQDLSLARERMVYEELYHLQMALLAIKSNMTQATKSQAYKGVDQPTLEGLYPFELTGAQKQAIEGIYTDMDQVYAMNRLLQGDVGSGKTAVAIAATYKAVSSGYQVAILAPTEILANQHYKVFERVFSKDYNLGLLTGQVKDKKNLLKGIEEGVVQVIVGTHALLQDKVRYKNLALVVTDEQHRFGVGQRQLLLDKGQTFVDTLVMSATPIPRTLSLILYGDMNVSTMQEKPQGRLPIKTHYIKAQKQEGMYSFIEERLSQGQQAYFVAPLIEENEDLDLVSAQDLYQDLSFRYKGHGVGLLHGKMKAQDKTLVMNAFLEGQIKVLVATTVIEVGVDVPKATLMVITHAERFGLSQLHQLRGRVGRGHDQSYCFLLSESVGKIARARIKALVDSDDGFEIANQDLSLRGPGEIIGTRQHGIPELKYADLLVHGHILERVQTDCLNWVSQHGFSQAYMQWLNKHLVL